jgi:hypothetical protein
VIVVCKFDRAQMLTRRSQESVSERLDDLTRLPSWKEGHSQPTDLHQVPDEAVEVRDMWSTQYYVLAHHYS